MFKGVCVVKVSLLPILISRINNNYFIFVGPVYQNVIVPVKGIRGLLLGYTCRPGKPASRVQRVSLNSQDILFFNSLFLHFLVCVCYGGPYLQTQETILETQHNVFETQHNIFETVTTQNYQNTNKNI